jgi:hypothetical protein
MLEEDVTDYKKVLSALQRGLDPNVRIGPYTILDTALERHAPKTAEVLFDHPDFDKEGTSGGFTPLLCAVYSAELGVAERMVDKKCDIHVFTFTGRDVIQVLYDSCSSETPGIESFVQRLTEHGGGWLLASKARVTPLCLGPLMQRMERDHMEFCLTLLSNVIRVKDLVGVVAEYLFS